MAVRELSPELVALWDAKSAELFERDGHNPVFSNGGHDIKNNPDLSSLLKKLSTGYLRICEDKILLLQEKERIRDEMLYAEELAHPNFARRLEVLEANTERLDHELVRLNGMAIKALTSSHGFRQEMDRYAGKPVTEGRVAFEIISALIKHCVAAACEHTGYTSGLYGEKWLERAEGIVPKSFGLDSGRK